MENSNSIDGAPDSMIATVVAAIELTNLFIVPPCFEFFNLLTFKVCLPGLPEALRKLINESQQVHSLDRLKNLIVADAKKKSANPT